MSDEGQPPRKKSRGPRGPYKTYLYDNSVSIPESTLRSWEARASSSSGVSTENSGESISHNVAENEDDVRTPTPEQQHEERPQEIETSPPHNTEEHDVQDRPHTPEVQGDAAETDERANQDASLAYILKHNLQSKITITSDHSKLDVLLMIFHLAIRHCYTQHFVEDQIKFVNTLLGDNYLDVSWHVFKTLFAPSAPFKRHYFCDVCEVYIGCDFPGNEKFQPCPKCQKQVNVKLVSSKNYFVTFCLRTQIEEKLKMPGVKVLFGDKSSGSEDICDVFDGLTYKKCAVRGGALDPEKHALTLNSNTDGAKVHNKTDNSLWPIFAFINEISPEQRFKPDNLILGGLWFGKSAPNMALYLKPFLEEVNSLSTNPVNYYRPDGKIIRCPVFHHDCSLDAPAKAKVLCQKQFNGADGCLYCYHPNDATVGNNKKLKYYDTSIKYSNRSEQEIVRDMYKANNLFQQGQLKKGDAVNGFFGLSPLLHSTKILDNFPCNPFNISTGVVIDYLHAVLEGVTTNLFDLYSQILSPQQMDVLNARLKSIKPPHVMTHGPRALSDRVNFRAKDYRALLLYYALPCLEDLLPKAHYANLKLFVNAIHIALSSRITPSQYRQGEEDMDKFVTGFQTLFGLEFVTYNLHLCSHIFRIIFHQGPIWCYSMFIFESGNGLLLRLLRGTRTVINELSTKYTSLLTAIRIIKNNCVNQSALLFCNYVVGDRDIKNFTDFDDVSAMGKKSSGVVTELECELLRDNNVKVIDSKVSFFNRVIRNGNVFYSNSYCKDFVFDDSCVILQDGRYAVLDKIVESESRNLLCLIKPVQISHDLIPSVKRCSYDSFGTPEIVQFSEVKEKRVLVSFEDKNFVCSIPNFFERD